MGSDFDRKGYIEAASFAITPGPDGARVALLKCIDGRTVMIPLRDKDMGEMLPGEILGVVPERVLRVTLEEVAPWGIGAEIHIQNGSGTRHFPCNGSQAFVFATTRRCPLFIRRSFLHEEGVSVSGEGRDEAFDAIADWVEPVREPLPIDQGMDETPIIRVANTILRRAIVEAASEVLLDCSQDGISVKFLIKEAWREEMTLPRHILAPLTARIKEMAEMTPSLKMETQEGWIPVKFESRRYDISLKAVPADYGENFEMRVFPV